MMPLSIIGLFCEDIREESGEIYTLVGLLPDNINVELAPAQGEQKTTVPSSQNRVLSKLCIFARANFDPDDPINRIDFSIVLPNDQRVELGAIKEDVFEKAKLQAKENRSPLAGVILRSILAAFRMSKPGLVRLEATIGKEKRTLAMLNFHQVSDATGPAMN